MGLWDHQIADLEALGIRFSDFEVDALEDPPEGLRALHLQPLWDPDTPEGQVCFIVGPDQGVVYVPEIIDLWHPTSTPNEYGGKPLWQAMDDEHGIDDGFPFYFATLDWKNEVVETPLSTFRSEEPKPYPFHGCLPLTTSLEAEAAERLVEYARKMLQDSFYHELEFLVATERDSEWCIEVADIWEQEVMGTEFPPEVERTIEEHLDMYGDDPGTLRGSIVAAFQRLIDDGFIKDPRWTPEQEEAYEHVPMKVGPLDLYIPDSDFLAKDLYQSITKRQRHFQRRWEHHRGTFSLNNLLAREGVYV